MTVLIEPILNMKMKMCSLLSFFTHEQHVEYMNSKSLGNLQ